MDSSTAVNLTLLKQEQNNFSDSVKFMAKKFCCNTEIITNKYMFKFESQIQSKGHSD